MSDAVAAGEAVLAAERRMHLAVESGVNAWTGGHHLLALALSDYYQFCHLPVTLGLLTWCWWRSDLYRQARNALVAINVVGFLVFLAVPVAPPRLLPGGAFTDLVALAGFGTGHAGGLPADQYAAMPSLHVAWAIWVALVGLRLTRRGWVRVLLVAHPVLTTVAVVATANHYLLDAVAGGAVTVLAAYLTGLVPTAVRLPRPGGAPGS